MDPAETQPSPSVTSLSTPMALQLQDQPQAQHQPQLHLETTTTVTTVPLAPMTTAMAPATADGPGLPTIQPSGLPTMPLADARHERSHMIGPIDLPSIHYFTINYLYRTYTTFFAHLSYNFPISYLSFSPRQFSVKSQSIASIFSSLLQRSQANLSQRHFTYNHLGKPCFQLSLLSSL